MKNYFVNNFVNKICFLAKPVEDPETTMAGGTIAAVVLGIIVGLIVIGVLVGVIWYVCYS